MPTDFEKTMGAVRNPKRVLHEREVAAGLAEPDVAASAPVTTKGNVDFFKQPALTDAEKTKRAKARAEALRKHMER